MPKISVIVPIYNVEKYLNRCVDSILKQTFTDFECILVDDGSPDKCPKICDEYAKKDMRIRVIHKENGGLSDARNAGIDAAQGEYLGFVDSDDWIHPQMYEILYNSIVENNVKMSICRAEVADEKREFRRIENPHFEVYSGLDILVSEYSVSACTKLYHRSLFRNIRYPVGRLHEDAFVIYKLFFEAGDVAFTENVLYEYFINCEGITHSKFSLKRLEVLDAEKEQCEFFKKLGIKKYYKWAIRHKAYTMYWQFQELLQNNDEEYIEASKAIAKELKKLLITKKIYADIKVKLYPHYYEVAFPHFMKYYWLFGVVKKKIAYEGFLHTMAKGIKRLRRRDF